MARQTHKTCSKDFKNSIKTHFRRIFKSWMGLQKVANKSNFKHVSGQWQTACNYECEKEIAFKGWLFSSYFWGTNCWWANSSWAKHPSNSSFAYCKFVGLATQFTHLTFQNKFNIRYKGNWFRFIDSIVLFASSTSIGFKMTWSPWVIWHACRMFGKYLSASNWNV